MSPFQVFSAIGSFVAKAKKFASFVSTVFRVATVVMGIKGFSQARDLLAKGQDILANKTAAGGKIPVIYGRRRVGAQIVYMDTASKRSKDLFIVYALSVGECEEIEGRTIELDGNPITDPNRFRDGWYIGSDKINSGAGSLNTADQEGINNGTASAGGGGTDPTKRYRAVFNLHHGAATQTADPMLRASVASEWTTAHKLNGITYIAASYEYDTKAMFKSVPQLTVVVKGQKVYDPRLDSTVTGGSGSQRLATPSTYAWNDNAACCFLNYLTNDQYGKGLTASDLDLESFRVAAVLTDTLVDTPDFNGSYASTTWSANGASTNTNVITFANESQWSKYKLGDTLSLKDSSGNLVVDGKTISDIQRNSFYGQTQQNIIIIDDEIDDDYDDEVGTSLVKSKRFHCNGVIDTNKNVMENAKELLGNMRGILNYVDGKYELLIEDTGSSQFTVTDDHIIDGISIDYGNKDNRANKVVVEFFNGAQGYEQDTATIYHNNSTSTYKNDDGGEELEVKVAAPLAVSPYVAWNMGKAVLERSRYQTSINFMATPELYKVNVGSIITVNYAGLGLSSKLFRIETMDLQANGLIAISAIEYIDIYTWQIPPVESVPPASDIPTGFELVVPTGLVLTDTSANNPRAYLSWTANLNYPVDSYRVIVLDSNSNSVINAIVNSNYIYLDLLPVGSYNATVTAINSVGTESNPSSSYAFSIAKEPIATDDVQDNAITNVKVNDLSAVKINTGELNLGTASGMAVKQAKSGYTDTTTGFWLGNDGGTPKFNIGTSTNYLKFDGSDLDIAGEISATTGSIGGFTVGSTSLIAGANATRISLSTANGIHLGNNTFANAPFKVGLNGALTATNATITGAIIATSLNVTNATVTGTLDASKITVDGDALDTLLGVAGTGANKVLSLGYDAKNKLEVTGTHLKYTAYDQVQANGDLALDMFETSATFYPSASRIGWIPTVINAGGQVTTRNLELNSQTTPTYSTSNLLYNVGGALYWNGNAVGTGNSNITSIVAGTNLNGGGNTGTVTLNLDSTITGNHTFSNNVIIGGDLTVQGTTVTVDTTNLDVKDKNITINYSTGDSSATANGAGITIQDAVSAGNDATLTWNTANDSFNFSHAANVTGNIGVTGTVDGRDIATDGTKLDGIEAGATTDQTQAEINALGITATGLSGTPNISVGTINSEAITITTAAVPLRFVESGNTGAGQYWRMPLDSGDLRFDVSTGGGASFSSYDEVFRMKSNGSINIQGSQMFDTTGSINTTRTINSSTIVSTGSITVFTNVLTSTNSLKLDSGQSSISLFNTGTYDAIYDAGTHFFRNASGAERLRIDSIGRIGLSGANYGSSGQVLTSNGNSHAPSWQASSGVVTTYTNGANNRIITSTGTAGINGEGNLTFDGSTLGVTGTISSGAITTSGTLTVDAGSNGMIDFGDVTSAYGRLYADSTGTYIGSKSNHSLFLRTNNQVALSISTDRKTTINSAYTLPNYAGSAGQALRLPLSGTELEWYTLTSFPSISVSGTATVGALDIPSNGTNDTRIEIGTSTLASHYAYIDLVGDTTYTDYGIRLIRNNGGANTSSRLIHRGTDSLFIEAQDAGSVVLKTNGSNGLTINSSQNATFAGTISSGRVTTSEDVRFTSNAYLRSDNIFSFLTIAGNAQSGKFKSVAAQTSYGNGASDGMFNALNGYAVGTGTGTTVLNASRQLENITGLGASTTNTATGNGVGFKFVATDTVVDQAFNGFTIDHNVSGSDTATADRTHIALNVDQDSSATGGDTSNEHRLYGVNINSRATGDSDLIRGINAGAISDHDTGTVTNVQGINALGKAIGEGQTTNVYGIIASVQKDAGGATSNMYGSYGKSNILSTNTATVTNAYGLYGEVELDSNTTLTNAFGVRSIIDRDNGTIGTGYLYRGNYQGTLPTTAWGVYIDTDVPNYFGGSVQSSSLKIGTTTVIDASRNLTNINIASSAQVEVTNTSTSTGEILFLKGGGSSGAGVLYNRNDSFTWYAGIGGGSGTGSIPLSYFGIVNRSQGTLPFVIAHTTGNVGIGVSDPEKKLEVKSDTTNDGILIDVLSKPEIIFRDRGNSDTIIGTGRYQLDGFHIDTYSGNALFIRGSDREVGIGKTNPTQKLDVNGNIGINGTQVIDASRNLTNIGTYTGTGNITISGASSPSVSLTDTTNNVNVLMYAQNSNAHIGTYSNHSLIFDVNSSAVLTLDSSNVATFAGTISSGGAITSGGTLTATSAGEAQVFLVSTAGVDNTSYIFNSDTNFGNYNGTDNHFYWFYDRSAGNFNVYAGSSLITRANSSGLQLHTGGYQIGGTTVIDASRNLTNIGNLSLVGDIYGTGNFDIRSTGNIYNTYGNSSSIFFRTQAGATKLTLDANGNGVFAGDVQAYSDKRLKDNIQTLDGKKALQMRGVSFTRDGKPSSGVIAQEVEKIAPELVMTADDEMGTKSVAYGNLVGYLIETVKDQQAQIDELKAMIEKVT